MDRWMKVTLAVSVPALSFLVLNDTVQGFYGPKRELPLSYSVIEEEPAPEEDVVEEEAEVEDAAEAETDTVEENVAEVAEEAPASEDAVVTEEATAEEAPVEEVAAEAAPVEETVAEAAPATEETGTEVALLTPEEMDAGEAAARACASCHQFERERNAAGPHLVGLNGRVIGSVDGFRYSRALQDLNAEGRVWDMEALQVWLDNPDAYAEGTRMMYKVDDAEQRRLIAGWLTQREN